MLPRFVILCEGCKPLEWDADGVRHGLIDRGLHETTRLSAADIVIIMGCTFTQQHEDDFRRLIVGVDHRKDNQHVIVSGCYLRQDPAERVHYARKEDVPALVDSILAERARSRPRTPRSRGKPLPFVAVSEGCYGNCTFCSIRLVRGRHRSRSTAQVVADLRAAFDTHGYAKLVGQEIAAYGRDRGTSLPALIRSIFGAVPRVVLELGTLGAAWMKDMPTADLALFADPRIRGNIHLPLQSASDSVLKRMRRGYTVDQFMELLAKLRSFGVTSFSTDIIAGFPGETLRDHARNLAFLKSACVAHAQIFAYDPRPGTAAASMRQLPRLVRVQRTLELIGVFLAHVRGFCDNQNADVNDFLNTNLDINKEEVDTSEG